MASWLTMIAPSTAASASRFCGGAASVRWGVWRLRGLLRFYVQVDGRADPVPEVHLGDPAAGRADLVREADLALVDGDPVLELERVGDVLVGDRAEEAPVLAGAGVEADEGGAQPLGHLVDLPPGFDRAA